MAIELKVKADPGPVLRGLASISGQMPFATALALTATARSAQRDTQTQTRVRFDRPKPYTVRAWLAIPARKGPQPTAQLLLKDRTSRAGNAPADILRHHYTAGIKRRLDKGVEDALQSMGYLRQGEQVAPPRQANAVSKRDRYGNMTRASIRRAIKALRTKTPQAGWRYFVPRRGHVLAPGVWAEKKGRGRNRLQPVFFFVDPFAYRQRLDVEDIARQALRKRFPREMRAAVRRALETRRR